MRFFFFQAEDGIRDLVRSRGLGDVYKRQINNNENIRYIYHSNRKVSLSKNVGINSACGKYIACLLYTSDAADERSSVDLGGRRIIKKKNNTEKL